jgi:hypothetical protein
MLLLTVFAQGSPTPVKLADIVERWKERSLQLVVPIT